MSIEKTDNTSCCTDSSCGCRVDIYPISAKCPECSQLLHLIGCSPQAEFRPNRTHCGYTDPLLSLEELGELL